MTAPMLNLPETETLWVGRRDHYMHATRLLDAAPARVVLIQRSSTLLLGPEEGWDAESGFFDAAWRSIDAGAEWFHIASSHGITAHLHRETSRFPDVGMAHSLLSFENGVVGLSGGRSNANPVKNVDRLAPRPDLKFDRQARMLIADFDGECEALLVENVGDRQLTLHVTKSAAAALFELGHQLWSECPEMTCDDLGGALSGVD